MKRLVRILILTLALLLTVSAIASCELIKPPVEKPTVGTISGKVLNADGEPINGVKVYYGEESFVEPDAEGNFVIENVSVGDITLTAKATGYADATCTLTADSFDDKGLCSANITMQALLGTLKGSVSVEGTGAVLAGVTIQVGDIEVTTDENGNYEIKDIPMPGTKIVTATKFGYVQKRETLTLRLFDENGVATIDFVIAEETITGVAGLTPGDLVDLQSLPAGVLLIDRNLLFSLPRSPYGAVGTSRVEEHGEGLCLNSDTRNDNAEMSSYVYGKVTIDANHKILKAYARTFFGQNGGSHEDESAGNFDNSKLAELGIYVIDENGVLHTDVAEFVKIDSESYKEITFDLSAFEGQTVVIIVGTKTGYHCCVDRMEFSSGEPSTEEEIIPGLKPSQLEGLTVLPSNVLDINRSILLSLGRSPYGILGDSSVTEHGEGLCLHSNTKEKLDYLAAYIYGKVAIDDNHQFLSIFARTFFGQNGDGTWDQENSGDFSNSSLAEIGIYIVDQNGKLHTDIADFVKIDSESYKEIKFDLSAFKGQTVTIIIGTNTGYHCCIDRMEFSSGVAETEIIPGLKPSKLEGLTVLPESVTTIDRTILLSLNRGPNALVGNSKVEEHGEGLCLNADTKTSYDYLLSYIYGKVKIDANHSTITIYARTFFGQNGGSHADEAAGNFSNSKLAELGIYIIDESGKLHTNIGDFVQIDTESYKEITFDLSAFEGQTVTIIIGTRTGYHCCIDRMEFSAK